MIIKTWKMLGFSASVEIILNIQHTVIVKIIINAFVNRMRVLFENIEWFCFQSKFMNQSGSQRQHDC